MTVQVAIRAVEESGAPACAAPSLRAWPAEEVPPRLAAAWAGLAADASEPNCFCEPWFVDASLRHLRGGATVRLAEAWQGLELIGVLPLAIERRYGRVPVRHVENWAHHHHFLGTPLVRAGRERDFWRALLRALDGAEWAPAFLHLNGLVEDGPLHRGLVAAAAELGRPCPVVKRERRALLQSDLSPRAYYEATVRKKKRKEIARLRGRLAELGPVACRALGEEESLEGWRDAFLALEASGWKGRQGSALAADPATRAFFADALAGARAAGRLQMLRLDLAGRPIAMLVNFLAPPGSFSFKTAFDEEFARFSPGVLIQLENLAILDRPGISDEKRSFQRELT